MYNIDKKIIILGEAKFYKNAKEGIKEIIKDFIKKNIKNKLESLVMKSNNNPVAKSIILKDIKYNNYNIRLK